MKFLPADTCVTRRQLSWVGHVWRMESDRLPRKILSSWVAEKRPRGCPEFTYAYGLNKALKKADVDKETWTILATDRQAWRSMIQSIN